MSDNKTQKRLPYVSNDLYHKIQALADQQKPIVVTIPSLVAHLLELGIKQYEANNQTQSA